MRSTHYFEDLEEGDTFVSGGRTVTEADLVSFAGISGDFNGIHMDAEAASSGRFGQRVVHGVLGIAIATGLLDRMGLFNSSMIAMLEIKEWAFRAPLFIGDTVHLELTIIRKRRTSSREAGIVDRRLRIIDQKGDVLQEGVITVMIHCRAADGADAHR